jgi:SAM-dependent methyltransferase
MTWASILWALVTLRLLAMAVHARRGLSAVPAPRSDGPLDPGYTLVATRGAVLVDPDVQAARRHAAAEGLDVVHLLPASGPASYAMTVGQLIDSALRSRSTSGGSVGTAFALVVRDDVLARSGLAVGAAERDPARHVVLARRLARYGPVGYVQAAGSSLDGDPFDDRATVGEAYGTDLYTVFSVPFMLGLVAAGPLFAPVVGWVAVAMLHLQVAVALAGSPFRLSNSSVVVETALRWLDLAGRWLRTLPQLPRRLLAEDAAAERSWYAEAVRNGTGHFFEEPATACPLCGDEALRRHLEVGDIWQGKPGRLRLDACRGCGHVFQNPRLSLDGLTYYYRDFYDGLGEDGIELLFDAEGQPYAARADFVLAHGAPRSWLDVGCGHGHFCHAIKQRVPGATVDGLDMSDGVLDAQRRGWLDEAHTGLFPELAPSLEGTYDVVSMSHYLEHTRDPRAEVAAAARALAPGGLFFVEVPDPSSWLGRMLGRFWLPWFQPQHQHFVQHDALQALMREHGLEPVASHRAEAHIPTEGILGTIAVLSMLAPTPEFPWRPPATLARRMGHSFVWGLGAPFLLLAVLFDRVTAPVFARIGASNAYRVLARKSEG